MVEVFSIGEEVFDPINQESLGTLDIIKDEWFVTSVYPQMAICEKKEKVIQMNFWFSSALENITGRKYLQKQKININAEEISGGFEQTDTVVRIGDSVRIYSIT